jgi:hypothetical protein
MTGADFAVKIGGCAGPERPASAPPDQFTL